MSDLTIHKHRTKLRSLINRVAKPASVFHRILKIHYKDTDISIDIFRPLKNAFNYDKLNYPTIYYIPGSAYVGFEKAYTDVICSHLAEMSKCQVITIRHRLAPKHDCYAILNDVIDLFQLLFSKHQQLVIDKKRFVIAGYSTGANLAVQLSQALLTKGIIPARQILFSPFLDLTRSKKGYEPKEACDKSLSNEFVEWFLKIAVPKAESRKDPLISPFWMPSLHKKFPTTDIIFGENDRFRGDSELFIEKLRANGIRVTKSIMPEGHNHHWVNPESIRIAATNVKSLFGLCAVPRPMPITHTKGYNASMMGYQNSINSSML